MHDRHEELQQQRLRKYVLAALSALLLVFLFLLRSEIFTIQSAKVKEDTVSNTEMPTVGSMIFTFPPQEGNVIAPEEEEEPILAEPATEVPTPRPPPTPRPTEIKPLRRGNKGDEVRNLQLRLVELRYLKDGDVDGNYGKGTLNAVKRFQQQNGLAPDGVAGRDTILKLYSKDAR